MVKNKNLRAFLYISLLIIIPVQAYSQKATVKNRPEYDDKPLQFGYMLGLNVMDFSFGRNYTYNSGEGLYADQASYAPGFQVGMVVDFRLGEYLNLRLQPGFNFGQRNVSFFEMGKDADNNPTTMLLVNTFDLESSMLDFPVLLKYKAKRINNYRPYVIGGASVRYDLASKKEYDESNTDESNNEYLMLKPFDVYAEMGFGIDYYLPYFKFTTELKLSLGFLNMLNTLKPKNEAGHIYVNSLNRLNSKIIMFSVYFQ